MENKMISATPRQDLSILGVIGESLLYGALPTSFAPNSATRPEAVKEAESALDALTSKIGSAELQEEIENAFSACLAEYETYSFQRGMQIGARIALELLGALPARHI